MRIMYEREIIVITGQYKNQRLRMGASEEASVGIDMSTLVKYVDAHLSRKVADIKRGMERHKDRAALSEEAMIDAYDADNEWDPT